MKRSNENCTRSAALGCLIQTVPLPGNGERARESFTRDSLEPHKPSGTTFSDFQFLGSLKLVRHVRCYSNSGQNVAVPRMTLSANGLNRSRDSVLRRAARAMGYWDVSVLS